MAAGGRSTTTTPQMRESSGITADEIRRLGKALQKQEFRDLLLDYVNEVNDPTNRARYEAEVTEAERQRGYRVTFLRPEPCYVLKTTVSLKAKNSRDTTTKAFVNICQCDAIEKPSCKRVSQAIARSFYNQESGLLWTVPHSLTYPRDDADRQGNKCLVYDCVYHPDTLRLARSNQQFKQMIEEIAFDAVENAFSIGIKRTGVKYPKMKFKGTPTTTLLRKKIDHRDDASESPESSESRPSDVDRESNDVALHAPVIPEYVIKYRHRRDMQDFAYVPTTAATTAPDELVVEVKLPALRSVSDVALDVTRDRLKLTSSPGTVSYALSIRLPYSVDDNGGNAKFCAATETLVVELPVVKTTVGISLSKEDDAAVTEDADAQMEGTADEGTDGEEPIWERLSELDIARLDGVKQRVACPPRSVVCGCPPLTSFPDNPSEGVDVVESPGITHVLPEFSCHQSNSELVLVLKASGVDRESVRVQYFEDGLKCRLSFHAAGHGIDDTGVYYSLFLVLLPECKLEVGQEQISVTEENAVVTLAKHCDSQHHWDSFRYGVDEEGAVQLEIMTMNALQRKLLILQNEIPVVAKRVQESNDNAPKVAITEVNCERLKIEIEEPHQQNGASTKMDDNPPNKEPDDNTEDKQDGGTLGNSDTQLQHGCPNIDSEQTNNKTTSSLHCSNNNGFNVAGLRLRKFRSFSESSDDVSPVHYPRSILKHTRRCHTLSESSDDFSWSSQDYTTVDSNIPEEGSLENLSSPTKKAVHFSEVISRNFFRSNSSILGQRKKNQRKQRKKCESRIRRSSESESSEIEADNQEGNNIETTTKTFCNGTTDLNQNHEVHDDPNVEFNNDNSSCCNSCSEQDNVNDNNYRNSKQDPKNNHFRKKKKQLPRQKINIAGDSASLDCTNTVVGVLLCSKSSSQGKRHSNRKRTVSF